MQSAGLTLCSSRPPPALSTSLKPSRVFDSKEPVSVSAEMRRSGVAFNAGSLKARINPHVPAIIGRRVSTGGIIAAASSGGGGGGGGSVSEMDGNVRKLLRALLWIAEGVYIIWLFLLPYAPGDPVWAISSETINSLIGLSLNFFFILPLSNSVGFHLMEAPVLHPMSEGLFNFVLGWTFMFAPVLFTDKMRSRFKGSVDVLWGFQMFLTNTSLIPYMAIRLNEADEEYAPRKTSQLGSVMISKAPVVGLIGGLACLLSVLWALYGRGDGNYGDFRERWEFLISYLGSERFVYAFIWDICLYVIFQPWLIGDNLENLQNDKIGIVSIVRFVPVVGLMAYCLCLNSESEK